MNADTKLLQHGMVLFEQGRIADAELRFRELLTHSPRHAIAHAMLSLCLTREERFDDATEEARHAIGDDPELPLGYYALASVMVRRNRDDEARLAIETAISLDQTNPSYHGLLAQLHLRKSLWRMALHAADQGLVYDPQNSLCLNIRATALVQLGERAQAATTVQDALAKDPENTNLHANRGWALLHEGKAKLAMGHFREALRLDPNNEWAKAGIVESLKASFFLYRWLLRYFLWMARFSPRVRSGIVIGGFIGYQALRSVANANPRLEPFIIPVLLAYSAFALLTWLAAAFFNLLLRIHPIGKYALNWKQKRSSELVGSLLLVTAVFVGCAFYFEPTARWVTLAIACFLTALPASVIFSCANGWPRLVQAAITLAVLGIGVYAGIDLGQQAFSNMATAALISQFAGMALRQVRLKR